MPPRFPPARLAAAGFSPVLTQVATAPCTRCRSGLNPRMHTPSEERAQPPTTTCRGLILCHVVPRSANCGRLMPPGAAFCPVFGGAFTVRFVIFSALIAAPNYTGSARSATNRRPIVAHSGTRSRALDLMVGGCPLHHLDAGAPERGGGHQAARHYVAYLAGTPCGGTARGNASGAMASTSSPPFVLPTRSNPAMRKQYPGSVFCAPTGTSEQS